MRIFEFYFNPSQDFGKKFEADSIFEIFCYQPENIYERKMGSLYQVGLLKNPLPKNLHFLKTIAELIKKEYYLKTILTPEKAFYKSLTKANKFLEEIAKKGDVSWLGNLSFAILNLKDLKLNFSKVGQIKILLLRAGKLIDIEKKLKLEEIQPYPLKVFGEIISGKLILNDLILIFSREVFNFFEEKKLIQEILKSPQFLDEGIKNFLAGKKEELLKVKGILLAISLTKEILPVKKEIVSVKNLKEFSLKEIFLGVFKSLKSKIITHRSLFLNKKFLLILALILVLIFGFLFTKIEKIQRIDRQDSKSRFLNLFSSTQFSSKNFNLLAKI